jgi:hypothetical protein
MHRNDMSAALYLTRERRTREVKYWLKRQVPPVESLSESYLELSKLRTQLRAGAPTVPESNVFIPFGLLLSEKQIPGFVGNVSS